MPLCARFNGLVGTALVALALLPVQYYVPELLAARDEGPGLPEDSQVTHKKQAWYDIPFAHFPALDLIFALIVFTLAFVNYLGEWIQRKLMEKRIVKLNQYLRGSVQRLRAWDARQRRLEGALRAAAGAAAEYNLLLHLLLRRRAPAHTGQPDKQLEDDFAFVIPL